MLYRSTGVCFSVVYPGVVYNMINIISTSFMLKSSREEK